MKYGDLTLGQVEAFMNKIGGMEGLRLFLAGELVVRPAKSQWKRWRTINLGTTGLRSGGDFLKLIKQEGFRVSGWASKALNDPAFRVTTEKTEIGVVVFTVGELGFEEGATIKEVYDKAQKIGLQFCPAEVGPQLRLQYGDQPKGEWLLIAMEPTPAHDNFRVFRVGHDENGRWLSSIYATFNDYFLPANTSLVFVLPRK